jgi:hypothetical protein
MLRVRRRRSGQVIVLLHPHAAAALLELPRQLRAVLASPDFSTSVLRRLFPAAYEDKAKEAEYRRLLGKDLVRAKLEGVAAFEETLAKPVIGRRRIAFVIEPEAFGLWLGFVNDMRLVLGTELDIQENDWSQTYVPRSGKARSFALLQFLSWLEEELLGASGFPGAA